MSVSRFRVENVLIFSASDLREGRVHFIPSTRCKNETDGDLNLLQQATDSRGSIHEQPLTIRISISRRRHAISVRFAFHKALVMYLFNFNFIKSNNWFELTQLLLSTVQELDHRSW